MVGKDTNTASVDNTFKKFGFNVGERDKVVTWRGHGSDF